jgi:hypothetical protein
VLISNQAAVPAFAAVLCRSQTKPQYRHSLLCCAVLKQGRNTGIRCCTVLTLNKSRGTGIRSCAVLISNNAAVPVKLAFLCENSS